MTEVDISIWTKWTPQQNTKANNVAQDDEQHNVAQDDEQHNVACKRWNHKKHKRKHLIYVEITYLDWKKGENGCKGVILGQKNDPQPHLLDEWKRKET